jgi:hypothetical protein
MLPPGGLSEVPQRGNFLVPDELSPVFNYPGDLDPQEIPADWEQAGVALNDPFAGLLYQDWTFYIDGPNIMVKPDNGPATVVHSPGHGVLELSGSFDSNMNPVVVWTGEDLVTWFRWWNPVTVSYALSTLPALRSPRLTLDDKRASQAENRDVLLFYIRNEQVCYRQQRDRYQIEYPLYPLPRGYDRIGRVGMTDGLRMQIELTLACPAFGLPGIPVDATGCDNADWCTNSPVDVPDAPPEVVAGVWPSAPCGTADWEQMPCWTCPPPVCKWCGVPYRYTSWDAEENAWVRSSYGGGAVPFIKPAYVDAVAWWRNPRPDSLTFEFKLGPGSYIWLKLYVKSESARVATIDLSAYATEVWHTITAPLNWDADPTGNLVVIDCESYIYSSYEMKLRICPNDTGEMCTGAY